MTAPPRPPAGEDRLPGSRGEPAGRPPVPVVLPPEVLRGPSGAPAAVVVRTTRGWAVLGEPAPAGPPDDRPVAVDELTLVEAMSLADLIVSDLGRTPEPDRASRRAARATPPEAGVPPVADPRDDEIASLRRTVGQLEHALAARVTIERAIGVLAERHGSSARGAFEDLRGRARSQGRPAAELAGEVLEGLPAHGTTAPGPPADSDPGTPPRDVPAGAVAEARS